MPPAWSTGRGCQAPPPSLRPCAGRFGPAPFVQELDHIGHLFLHGIEIGHFAEHAVGATLGAGAVVTGDVEDQRVVALARVLHRLEETAHLVVGHFQESGKHFELAGEQALLVSRQLIPVRDRLGLGCELRALGDNTELDLPCQDLLAELVPALVELSLPAVNPHLRDMVRRMNCTRRVVDEERSVRGQGLLVLDPGDGLIGHIGEEVIIRVVGQLNLVGTVVDKRRPLVGFATQEAVELVESLTCRPAIEWARGARLPGGRFVPLAEGSRAVAVEAQHLGDRSDIVGNLAGVAGKCRARFDDRAHVVDMVVAPAFDRRARR